VAFNVQHVCRKKIFSRRHVAKFCYSRSLTVSSHYFSASFAPRKDYPSFSFSDSEMHLLDEVTVCPIPRCVAGGLRCCECCDRRPRSAALWFFPMYIKERVQPVSCWPDQRHLRERTLTRTLISAAWHLERCVHRYRTMTDWWSHLSTPIGL